MALFEEYVGIDYSGSGKPTERLKTLQVYSSNRETPPQKVFSDDTGWNWTRALIAEWLVKSLKETRPKIVGIDHAFSYPGIYFSKHDLSSWNDFLGHVRGCWPTQITAVKDLPCKPEGSENELRLTERWTCHAKSVFGFDVKQGQVAKSTLSGLPWLIHIREQLGSKVHFWPFDGFAFPEGKSVVAEVYPSIFRRRYAQCGLKGDDLDAYSISMWLRERDQLGFLHHYLAPNLSEEEMRMAQLEGWILGVA